MTKNDREILGKLTDVISSLQTEITSLKEEINELRKDRNALSFNTELSAIKNELSGAIKQQKEYNYRIVYGNGFKCRASSMMWLRPGIDYILKNGRYYKIIRMSSEMNSDFIDVVADKWGSTYYDDDRNAYILQI